MTKNVRTKIKTWNDGWLTQNLANHGFDKNKYLFWFRSQIFISANGFTKLPAPILSRDERCLLKTEIIISKFNLLDNYLDNFEAYNRLLRHN